MILSTNFLLTLRSSVSIGNASLIFHLTPEAYGIIQERLDILSLLFVSERMKKDGNLVEIKDLSFAYGDREILNTVDLSFKAGSITAIMGASGMGKTTLLKLIGGLLSPQAGTITIGGTRLDTTNKKTLYELRRNMGMLFQFGALFTDLTVFENVAFPLREHTNLSESMIHDLVLLKLDAVGLRGASGLYPSEVSGGMSRRIALARAVALDPTLIMYDEPFAGLDPISMGVTSQLIKKLNDALGSTSLIVTHDVQETFDIADYVYIISSGKVAAEGTPQELTKSKDPFVIQFLKGQPDGPVKFHYPAPPLSTELGMNHEHSKLN